MRDALNGLMTTMVATASGRFPFLRFDGGTLQKLPALSLAFPLVEFFVIMVLSSCGFAQLVSHSVTLLGWDRRRPPLARLRPLPVKPGLTAYVDGKRHCCPFIDFSNLPPM